MTKTAIRALVDDIIDALDAAVVRADRCKSALLGPYERRETRDLEVASIDPESGAPTTRGYARTLGPPLDLGGAEHPDELLPLARRLERYGGRTRGLRRVARSAHELGHLVLSYERGLYASLPIVEWRATVTKFHEEVGRLAGEAREELERWENDVADVGPDSSVLRGQVLVFAETLVKMFGGEIKLDAARKMISSGRMGTVRRIGKRKAVLQTEMLEAMAKNASRERGSSSKAVASPLLSVRSRRRRKAGSKPTAPASPRNARRPQGEPRT